MQDLRAGLGLALWDPHEIFLIIFDSTKRPYVYVFKWIVIIDLGTPMGKKIKN